MDHLHQDPFRILEHIATPVPFPKETLALARADWKETPSSHLITLDIPGLKKDDVKIEVEENRVLRVSGERKDKNEVEKEVEREKWHRVERVNGKFLRQFRLPLNADLEKVQAHLEDGVLRVLVPKFAEEKRRQPKIINIDSHSSSGEDIKTSKAEM